LYRYSLEDMWRELDDHELIHTIDPAKNQGGNHGGAVQV
jgi:hypothetical protein